MDSRNCKKLTHDDGKSIKATDFVTSVELGVERTKSERSALKYLPETSESDGNRLKCQLSIPESSRNPFESPWLPLFDVHTCSDSSALKSAKVESYGFLSTPRTGAGLENLGNTCYLNAVLQCFIHTVPFVQGILSDTHSVQCKGNEEGFCLRCTLHELVKRSFTLKNQVISPWKIVNNLSYFSSSLQRSRQEDAHEFLQSLLSGLGSCYERMGKDVESSKSDNFVTQVFGGRIVSKVMCCKCGHISVNLEPSVGLSLEIEDANSLTTALQSFTKVEKIEDPEAKFTCEECKDKVYIEKQLAFDQVPAVATFHLKRFKTKCHLVQKIDNHVEFPLELDLLPFTARGETNDVELKYVLHAVLVHGGRSFSSGHYYCFIRLSPDTWCKFDDSSVVRVREDDVLSQKAYILFYAKEGTTWFSSFIGGTSFSSPTLHKNVGCESDDGTSDMLYEVNLREDEAGAVGNSQNIAQTHISPTSYQTKIGDTNSHSLGIRLDALPDHIKQEIFVRVPVRHLCILRAAIPRWQRVIDPIIKVRRPLDERRELLVDILWFLYIKGTSVNSALIKTTAFDPKLAKRFNRLLERLILCQLHAKKVTYADIDFDEWNSITFEAMLEDVELELAPKNILARIELLEDYWMVFQPI